MAETSASKLSKRIHTDGSTHYKGATAPANVVEGDLWYDTSEGALKFYDGSIFVKVSSTQAELSSVTGDIVAGGATTLTLAGSGFLISNLVVNFLQVSDSIDVDVTVTPSSDTAATVTVPSSVYSNVTSGNVVTIKVTNSDSSSSDNQTKTAIALPSGGTITTSGDYRYHTFTSSGTFTNTLAGLVTEYLVIAGGGGGGAASARAGGGGAGGLRNGSLTLSTTGGKTVTIGAGGSGSSTFSQVASTQNGNNSVFDSITSTAGGGGGNGSTDTDSYIFGADGGSGGCGGG